MPGGFKCCDYLGSRKQEAADATDRQHIYIYYHLCWFVFCVDREGVWRNTILVWTCVEQSTGFPKEKKKRPTAVQVQYLHLSLGGSVSSKFPILQGKKDWNFVCPSAATLLKCVWKFRDPRLFLFFRGTVPFKENLKRLVSALSVTQRRQQWWEFWFYFSSTIV